MSRRLGCSCREDTASQLDVAAGRLLAGQVEFNADKGDKQGPITLAAAASAPATVTPPPSNATPANPDSERKPESRVVAVGDSDFAANVAIVGFLVFRLWRRKHAARAPAVIQVNSS